MAKKINLPKTNISSNADLITIIQNGVEKNITKHQLLKYLEDSLKTISARVSSANSEAARNKINIDSPSFVNAVSAADPSLPNNLTTKRYVDNGLQNVVKNDGSVKLNKNLSYRSNPRVYGDSDVVAKKYVDDKLKNTLKTVQKEKGLNGYPAASPGDCYIFEDDLSVFATNGPEIQAGDLLICIEKSDGGIHSAVGHQFAIVNTNVIYSTEEKAGILRVASEADVSALTSNDAALTPVKYKRALEVGSEFNRTLITNNTRILTEGDKGVVGVETDKFAVTLTLPSIGRMVNAKLSKFTIKDESGNALKNNITILCGTGDTIENSRSIVINSNFSSVKLYNDGSNKWYIENNTVALSSLSSGVKTFATDDFVKGERASGTGAYESVMSFDVDLRDYPLGTAFKLSCYWKAAANTQDKKVAFSVGDNTDLSASSLVDANPNGKFVRMESIILHTDTPLTTAMHTIMMNDSNVLNGISNTLDLDWNTTIKVSADVLCATAATDVSVYSFQVIPMR